MATILNAPLVKVDEVDMQNIQTILAYDLIGFGSGIYWGKHDKALLDLVGTLPLVNNKKAFIFSTSGIREGRFINNFNRQLKRKLLAKGFTISGVFSCRGFDTVGPLKLIGGIRKGRPNEQDLEAAANFAKELG